MTTAPKKPTAKKAVLSPEEQALAIKARREAIEVRIQRLQAKIDKDKALLLKYHETPPAEEAAAQG